MKKLFCVLCILFPIVFILSCKQITETTEEITQVNYIVPVWKGSLPTAPSNPEVGWAYYNTTVKKSFIYDGYEWQIMAQDGTDGTGITWKGELSSAPSNPKINWAYYNTIDGNSYIYNGTSWGYLAKSGKDGASGILLWLGSYDTVPENPSDGWAYYNTNDGISYIYSYGSWQILSKDGNGIIWKGVLSVAPESPEINWAYYDTTNQTSYIWNGTNWDTLSVSLGGDTTVTVGITWLGTFDSAPLSPLIGYAYYNTSTGASYIYDGTVWQQISKDGIDGKDGSDGKDGTNGSSTTITGYLITWKGSYSSAPTNPKAGWAYYNTSTKKSYIYDGSSWQIMAQDGVDGKDGSDGSSGGGTTPTNYLYVLLYTSKGNYTQYATQTITEVDFGQIGIGSVAKTTTFSIGINGMSTSTLNLTGSPLIQISGENADQFEITQPSTTTTKSGSWIMDACIAFKPTSIGQKTATITIPNNSPDLPDFTFTVTGKGSYYPKTFDSGEGDGRDAVTKILTDSSNNVYVIGYGWELENNHSGFDWWIKKFNSTGIQQWEKVFDFYDDGSGSSYSPSYDNPKYAILDNFENLIIASPYNTIKLDSSGTKLWELAVGGEIFCDSDNNIIIGKSKYNSSGTLLWTNELLSTPAFDSSNNIYCTSGNVVQKINSDGSNNWTTISVGSTGRYNGNVSTNETQRLAYSVSSGNKYLLSWDDYYGTALDTKTAYLYVSAKYETASGSVFSQMTSGYGTRGQKFTASTTGNVLVDLKTIANYSQYAGSYAIALYQNYTSGSDFASSDWTSGTLTTNGSKTYSLSVIKGRPYVICINEKGSNGDGTKTADAKVSAAYSDGASIFSNKDSTYNSPELFFATQTGTVTIIVETYGSSSSYAGTFGIAKKELPYIQPKISGFNTGITNGTSICLDSSNNIYVAGYDTNKADTYSKNDIVIKKFNSSGAEITAGWNKTIDYGHCDNEVPNKILFNGTNIIMIGTGYDSISGSSGSDGLFYVYDTAGTLKTSFEIPYWYDSSYNSDRCSYIGKDSSGNYYFTAYESKYLLLKYSSSGNSVWSINTDIYDSVGAIDSLDYIYVGGYGSNLCSTTSNTDWYMKKYSSDGVEQ